MTSRPTRSRRCPTLRRPSRCPTSRSPTFRGKTRADRITVRDPAALTRAETRKSARRWLFRYGLDLALAYVFAAIDTTAILVPLRGQTYTDFAEKNMARVVILIVLGTIFVAVAGAVSLAPTLRWF